MGGGPCRNAGASLGRWGGRGVAVLVSLPAAILMKGPTMDLASIENRAAAMNCAFEPGTESDACPLGHAAQLTDEENAQRVHLGDPVAFAALTVRYWSAVHRMARSMLREASEADEATEETFLLALHSPELFPPDVLFRTSLYRVAIDRALTRLRSSPRDAESAANFFPTFDAAGRLATDESDWSGFGETLIKRTDLATQIREGLGRMDELDRASFILRDVEQLPAEEVAAVLRTSPEEVRERAHRARLMMADFLRQLVSSSAREAAALRRRASDSAREGYAEMTVPARVSDMGGRRWTSKIWND